MQQPHCAVRNVSVGSTAVLLIQPLMKDRQYKLSSLLQDRDRESRQKSFLKNVININYVNI
jgi:heme exporter protein D